MTLNLEGGLLFLVVITSLPLQRLVYSPEETFKLAASFAASLDPGDVVFLQGPMGSGKTHFVRGICAGLGMENLYEVDSPTYTLVNHYSCGKGIDHLDLYRFQSAEALDDIHFDELLQADTIKLIEWPERIVNRGPIRVDYLVKIKPISETERSIQLFDTKEVTP